eukprot:365942-Chlamydomonas_euryale.AAC.75
MTRRWTGTAPAPWTGGMGGDSGARLWYGILDRSIGKRGRTGREPGLGTASWTGHREGGGGLGESQALVRHPGQVNREAGADWEGARLWYGILDRCFVGGWVGGVGSGGSQGQAVTAGTRSRAKLLRLDTTMQRVHASLRLNVYGLNAQQAHQQGTSTLGRNKHTGKEQAHWEGTSTSGRNKHTGKEQTHQEGTCIPGRDKPIKKEQAHRKGTCTSERNKAARLSTHTLHKTTSRGDNSHRGQTSRRDSSQGGTTTRWSTLIRGNL